MFTNKKQVLMEQVTELEELLSEERDAHEADRKSLEELQDRIDLEERTYKELREALQKPLEMDEKARQYDIEEDVKRKSLQKELTKKRDLTEQMIEQYRKEQTDILQKRIKAFNNEYNAYFSRIHHALNLLNETALQIGRTFLETDTDISGAFQARLKDCFHESSKEAPPTLQEHIRAEVVSDDVPFSMREDAPEELNNIESILQIAAVDQAIDEKKIEKPDGQAEVTPGKRKKHPVDILLKQKNDRRTLPNVPDPEGIRMGGDRRGNISV